MIPITGDALEQVRGNPIAAQPLDNGGFMAGLLGTKPGASIAPTATPGMTPS